MVYSSGVDISSFEGTETLAGDWKGSPQQNSQLSAYARKANLTKKTFRALNNIEQY